MVRPHVRLDEREPIDNATSWALGWAVQERPGGPVILHSGGQAGFRSMAMASVDRKSGFILLTNSDNGGKVIWDPRVVSLLDRVLGIP
jgi:hypothetical protein